MVGARRRIEIAETRSAPIPAAASVSGRRPRHDVIFFARRKIKPRIFAAPTMCDGVRHGFPSACLVPTYRDNFFNCKRGFAYSILFINRGFEEHSSETEDMPEFHACDPFK
jgi:hypothetical protein